MANWALHSSPKFITGVKYIDTNVSTNTIQIKIKYCEKKILNSRNSKARTHFVVQLRYNRLYKVRQFKNETGILMLKVNGGE